MGTLVYIVLALCCAFQKGLQGFLRCSFPTLASRLGAQRAHAGWWCGEFVGCARPSY